MPTFAHTETSCALDPQINDDAAGYAKRFGDTSSKWTIEQVPDGTQHGAKSDGHGGWVNPVVVMPAPVPLPPATTKQQLLDWLAAGQALANQLPDK